jgi:hypothetical protein
MKVGKLREGHDYKFRVKAVNRQGESQYLSTPTAITAKDPFGTFIDFAVFICTIIYRETWQT